MRRAQIVWRLSRALEYWHDGETRLAVKVIEDLRRELDRTRRRDDGVCCDQCGLWFAWPGLLDYHLVTSRCGETRSAA